MNIDFIKGIIVPILTPIDENENIDEKKLRMMVDHVIGGGVHGILAYGSNGEFYGVEEKEMERGLKIIVDQADRRVPVYMGIGSIRRNRQSVLRGWPGRWERTGFRCYSPCLLNQMMTSCMIIL